MFYQFSLEIAPKDSKSKNATIKVIYLLHSNPWWNIFLSLIIKRTPILLIFLVLILVSIEKLEIGIARALADDFDVVVGVVVDRVGAGVDVDVGGSLGFVEGSRGLGVELDIGRGFEDGDDLFAGLSELGGGVRRWGRVRTREASFDAAQVVG
jgi:hypothetical protein